ncbi:MAG: Flp pilus assembly protein CpaB [Firmicutes bacterium]|nr:Flp pilus assembly protein CpaB [Bacillota bacterium]
MDKGKIIRLVLIPIVLGLVVTLIVHQVMAGSSGAAAGAAVVEMTTVVAVGGKEPVPARTKLTEQHLVVKQVPKSVLTGQEFAAVKDVVGQISTISLQPGELVLKSRVVAEGMGSLPYRIPAGTRATTIRIDELSGVAGHPEPGDLIDLVLFLPSKAPERPLASARMLYESVLVLAKGPAAPAQGGATVAAEAPKLTSLTVALKPDAAVEVAMAEQLGLIHVLLRPALKEDNVGRLSTNETIYK